MNVLAYSSQKPEKVGPRVETLLRAELSAAQPLPYEIEAGDAGKTTAGKVLKEGLSLLFGGHKEKRIFSVVFNLEQPRPARAEIHMNRQGVGCHGGTILYTATLSKPIKGAVSLEDPKMFGKSKFTADAEAADVAEKLNGNKELIKAANGFARVKSNVGGLDITAPRLLKIAPQDGGGALLVIATLPRPYFMRFKVSLDAKVFFQIAEMIEAAL